MMATLPTQTLLLPSWPSIRSSSASSAAPVRSSPPRFGRLAFRQDVLSERGGALRQAWAQDALRERIALTVRNGTFQHAPHKAQAFLETLDELCRSNCPDEKIYPALRQCFEQLSGGELHAENTHRLQRRLDGLDALLGTSFKPGRYLDIGCGSGIITRGVKQHYNLSARQVVGLDVVDVSDLRPDVIALQYDGRYFDALASNQFDVASLFTVLHHVDNPERTLREAYRVLKPGGRLIVREFDAPDAASRLFNLVMDHMLYEVYTFAPDVPVLSDGYRGREGWLNLFRQVGFTYHAQRDVLNGDVNNPNNPYQPFMVALTKPKAPVRHLNGVPPVRFASAR